MRKLSFNKKIILLILILTVTVVALFPLYTICGLFYDRPDSYIEQYFKEPENSIDGLFVGSSAIYRYWVGPKAFEHNGMATYCYNSPGTPAFAYKTMTKKALETQSPEFLVVDLRIFAKDPDRIETKQALKIINYMRPCIARLEIISDFIKADMRYSADISKNPFDYAFPEFRGKGDLVKNLVKYKRSHYKGFLLYPELTDYSTDVPDFTEDAVSLSHDYEDVLKDYLEYCKTLDCDVIFVATPSAESYEYLARVNRAAEIVSDYGFEAINMNNRTAVSEMGIDYSTDFHNAKHIEVTGAVKFTEYLADILDERYSLPDHRGDEAYQSWQDAADKLNSLYSFD